MISIVPGLIAAALLLRLFGFGVTVLPRPTTLLAVLVAFHFSLMVGRRTRLAAWTAFMRAHAFDIGLAALVVLTLLVRVPGFANDLGHVPLDIDEHRLAANVKHYFVTGKLGHETVEHYPGAVFWMFAAASFLSYLRGLTNGLTASPQFVPVETFVHAARLSNILVAGATVAVTGLLGRRFGGPVVGILAAAVVAIIPLSVDTTVLVRNDPGMVLAVTAAVLAALVAHETGQRSWLAAAAVLAGAATAIKYSSAFALVPVLIAAVAVGTTRLRMNRAALAVVAFAAAVMITNHFVWTDVPNFLRQLSDQIAITGRSHWAATDNPGAFYLMILDRFGFGVWMLILAAAFAVHGLATRQVTVWMLLSFPVLYVLFMTQRPSQFPRWVYPLVPFVAVAGASALAATARATVRAAAGQPRALSYAIRVVATLLVLVVLWPVARAGAVSFSRRITVPTHTLTENWLKAKTSPGEVVILGEGWLDLSDAPVVLRRVKNLRATLDEGVGALAEADWLVVPEPYMGHPTLKQLGLVLRVHAGQSFAGSQGYDYEVYAVPDLGPEEDETRRN